MDLLSEENTLDLYDRRWKIYSKNRHLPPHYVASDASVHNCLINEGCVVEGHMENCVLFNEIKIKKNAKIKNSVILSGAVVEEDCEIYNSVIMENVVVKSGTVIGKPKDHQVYLVGKNKIVESE